MFDLLPVVVRATIPELHSQEDSDDPTVYAKFYAPGELQFWLVTEFDSQDQDTCFGWIIDGQDGEFGNFSLSWLQSTGMPTMSYERTNGSRVNFGSMPNILRDKEFVPCLLSEARAAIETE